MLIKEDTRETSKEKPYPTKLWGMKKYANQKYTESIVVLKRKNRAEAKPLVYQATEPEYNFLKYIRIVRRWAKDKYNVTTSDLEILLFLYDENIWKQKDFNHATEIHTWEKNRLKRYISNGWVRVWRDGEGYKGHAKLYELTPQAKRICKSFYLKLVQKEPIPETPQNNPMYKVSNDSFTLNAYKKAIARMNAKREASRREDGSYGNK